LKYIIWSISFEVYHLKYIIWTWFQTQSNWSSSISLLHFSPFVCYSSPTWDYGMWRILGLHITLSIDIRWSVTSETTRFATERIWFSLYSKLCWSYFWVSWDTAGSTTRSVFRSRVMWSIGWVPRAHLGILDWRWASFCIFRKSHCGYFEVSLKGYDGSSLTELA
jgi:hypothetical protein